MISPKISVIIPNYNHAVYLRQRIDSVLNQTYRDFEVIILDDNSTDGSREIINSYRNHPQVETINFSKVNSGNPFRQWEKGLSLSSGEWVWIAESDDYASPTFLEKMIDALKDKANIGMAYCDSIVVHGQDAIENTFALIKNKKFNTDRWSVNHINDGKKEIFEYLLPGGTINNSSAVLFNKKILMSVNPFDLNLRYIGDKYAFVKVLSNSDVAYISEPLNYFRDPFNVKHADRYVYYFFEQFLVFDWVYRNLTITDKRNFFKAFYTNTRNSLFRDWNKTKRELYLELFKKNTYLFLKSVNHNLWKGVESLLAGK